MPVDSEEQVLDLKTHDFLAEMCIYRFRHGPDYVFRDLSHLRIRGLNGTFDANTVSEAVKYVVGHVRPELLDNITELASLEVAVHDKVKRWRFIQGTRHGVAQQANDELEALAQMEEG